MDKPYRGGKFAQKKQTKSQKKESNRSKQQSADQPPSRRITRQSLNNNDVHDGSSQATFVSANTTQPPWRQPQPAHFTGEVPASLQAVDSWRSYANNGIAPYNSDLNPQASSFTPYQPLRISNGQAECRVIQGSQRPLHTAAQAYLQTMSNQPSADLMSPAMYNTRDQHATPDPDVPIASVEQTDIYAHSVTRNLRSTSIAPPKPPSPTEAYLLEAAKEPVFTATPRKLLVILDLNGTLLHRPSNVNRTIYSVRPGVPEFLDYVFEHHRVMIYTSTRLYNAQVVVDKVLTTRQRAQLVALWARDMLDLTEKQYNAKVQVYKKLEKVWRSPQIQATAGPYGQWDQTNTVLVDDSHLKALAQPHNLLQIAEYTKALDPKYFKGTSADDARITQENVMKQLELQLEALKCQIDVSRLIRRWQMRRRPQSTAAGQDGPETVSAGSIKEEEALGPARQLLTPQSLEDTPERADEDPESISESEGGAKLNHDSRSVSPISEDTFKDLLSGLSVKAAPTPPAEGKP